MNFCFKRCLVHLNITCRVLKVSTLVFPLIAWRPLLKEQSQQRSVHLQQVFCIFCSNRKFMFFTFHVYLSLSLSISLQVHRLIIVDNAHKVIGVLSLSDILKFLVLSGHNQKISGTVQMSCKTSICLWIEQIKQKLRNKKRL